MSYMRNRRGLGAAYDVPLPPSMLLGSAGSAFTGLDAANKAGCPAGYVGQYDGTCCPAGQTKNPSTGTCLASAAAAGCPAGYVKDIAGNCTKAATTSSFNFGGVTSFLTDWFKSSQVAKGQAAGAAEGLALLQAQQQQSSIAQYLPYLLIGGGVLATVLIMRNR